MKLLKMATSQGMLHGLNCRSLLRPDEDLLIPLQQSLILLLPRRDFFSAKLKHILIYSMVVIFTAVIGCDHSKRRGISGKVYIDPDIDHSMMVSGDIEQNEYKAVTDATVYLAFDKEGSRTVEGTTVITNSSGSYYIKSSELPPPKDPSGCYYLVVKKKGHDVFSHPVKIGTMSSYQQNRVFLSQPSK